MADASKNGRKLYVPEFYRTLPAGGVLNAKHRRPAHTPTAAPAGFAPCTIDCGRGTRGHSPGPRASCPRKVSRRRRETLMPPPRRPRALCLRTQSSIPSRRRANPYIRTVNPLIDRFTPQPRLFSLPPSAEDCRGQDALAPKEKGASPPRREGGRVGGRKPHAGRRRGAASGRWRTWTCGTPYGATHKGSRTEESKTHPSP